MPVFAEQSRGDLNPELPWHQLRRPAQLSCGQKGFPGEFGVRPGFCAIPVPWHSHRD